MSVHALHWAQGTRPRNKLQAREAGREKRESRRLTMSLAFATAPGSPLLSAVEECADVPTLTGRHTVWAARTASVPVAAHDTCFVTFDGHPSSALVRSAQHPVTGAPRSAPQTSSVLGRLRGEEEAQEGTRAVKGFRSRLTLNSKPHSDLNSDDKLNQVNL